MANSPHPRPTVLLSFFNDTATTEIYTLSLHDALPIYFRYDAEQERACTISFFFIPKVDRKSTRLNSSHLVISYAVFCLKKNHGGETRCASLISRSLPLPSLSARTR